MKKLISIILVTLFTLGLVSCSQSKQEANTTSTNSTQSQASKNEPTQEELNAKLKSEAVKADFVTINGHESEVSGKKVFSEGQISAVDNEGKYDLFKGFTISQKEGDGFGIYYVYNLTDDKSFENGDQVKIYGTVNKEKSKLGMSVIVATVIEKK